MEGEQKRDEGKDRIGRDMIWKRRTLGQDGRELEKKEKRKGRGRRKDRIGCRRDRHWKRMKQDRRRKRNRRGWKRYRKRGKSLILQNYNVYKTFSPRGQNFPFPSIFYSFGLLFITFLLLFLCDANIEGFVWGSNCAFWRVRSCKKRVISCCW